MDSTIFILILFLVFIGIPVFIVFLSYIIPKKLGYPRTAKYLSRTIAVIFIGYVIYLTFIDYFFTKNNAIELLSKEDIRLEDEFDISHNSSSSVIGIGADHYNTFALKISYADKKRIISAIKNSEHFQPGILKEEDISIGPYFGNYADENKEQFVYYETEKSYVRERYTPYKPGYVPDFIRISIDKEENKLIFEDIGE